jgi:hypothetical protein
MKNSASSQTLGFKKFQEKKNRKERKEKPQRTQRIVQRTQRKTAKNAKFSAFELHSTSELPQALVNCCRIQLNCRRL